MPSNAARFDHGRSEEGKKKEEEEKEEEKNERSRLLFWRPRFHFPSGFLRVRHYDASLSSIRWRLANNMMRRERALTSRAYDNIIYGGLRNDLVLWHFLPSTLEAHWRKYRPQTRDTDRIKVGMDLQSHPGITING